MNLEQKFRKAITSKNAIKQAIINKGVSIGDVFDEYASAIDSIQTGIIPTGTLEITENGEYDVTNYEKATVNVEASGGEIGTGIYHIRYFDIDGTILKEERINKGDSLTPPDNPSYDFDYLIFDSWNYDIANTVVDGPLDIGAIYNTIDNATYLFCRFTNNTGLEVTLKSIDGSYTIDWGDGTVNSSLTHTYANEGEYIIKISGSFSFQYINSTAGLLGDSLLNDALQKIYIGNMENIVGYLFDACTLLQIISLSNSITTIGTEAFRYCYRLQHVNIPNSITTIDSYAFEACGALQSVSMPISITALSGTFDSCVSLKKVVIPNSVVDINKRVFYNCRQLQDLVIPKNVTTIGNNTFMTSFLVINYFILCEQVPTIGSASFDGLNAVCTMWVNDVIYTELRTTNNWSTYASYMKKLSDCPQYLLDENGIERPEPLPEPSGFTVTINGSGYDYDSTAGGWYSFDDGTTWTHIDGSLTLSYVTQIKFKVEGRGGYYVEDENNDIICSTDYNDVDESENIIVTADREFSLYWIGD